MRARLGMWPGNRYGRLLLAGTALLAFAACGERRDAGASPEMAWAKAALERNPNLEVVATDLQSRVFTVRDRSTGEIVTVSAGGLAAAPPDLLTGPATAKVERTPHDPLAEIEPASSDGAVKDRPATLAGVASAGEQASGPAPASGKNEYTIERVDGRVRVSGPGLSIVSAGSAPVATARGEPGQRPVDPIICEGRRMMQLDGREIYVEGDAITVRGGCELFLTNSRVVAAGTGIVVRDGIAHVSNSYVEGHGASFDAGARSRLYLRDSTFQGMSRRDSMATIQDQGGNQLR